MAKNGEKVSRSLLLESEEFTGIREALNDAADAYQQAGKPWNFWKPIRETPLAVFFDKSEGSMMEMRTNPNLDRIWHERYGIRIGQYAGKGGHSVRETVSVPNTLSILKISDSIIEGAEPWSDWKQYSRIEDMDAPKVNVPKTRYTNQVGGQTADKIDIFKESGGKPPTIGGKMEPIELDCSNTKNSFRGTIRVERNDVKDNNFLAVEQPLKNAGNLFYYLAGKRIIDCSGTFPTFQTFIDASGGSVADAPDSGDVPDCGLNIQGGTETSTDWGISFASRQVNNTPGYSERFNATGGGDGAFRDLWIVRCESDISGSINAIAKAFHNDPHSLPRILA
jgi:hypothetical protein